MPEIRASNTMDFASTGRWPYFERFLGLAAAREFMRS